MSWKETGKRVTGAAAPQARYSFGFGEGCRGAGGHTRANREERHDCFFRPSQCTQMYPKYPSAARVRSHRIEPSEQTKQNSCSSHSVVCGHHTHTDVLPPGAGSACRCAVRLRTAVASGARRAARVCLCVLCIWSSSLSCVYVTHARLRYAGSNTSWTRARHMPHARSHARYRLF